MSEENGFKFGESAYETLKNVFMAYIGDFVDAEPRPDCEKVMSDLEDFIGRLPSLYRTGIVLILRGVEVAPYAMGYGHQFSSLGRDDQVRFLDAFEKSSNYIQRAISLALKSIIVMIYFSDHDMEQAVGYDHLCLVEAKGRS